MDYASVQKIIEEDANRGPLLLYIAIGCSLKYYPEGAHPKQQYPSFLKTFPYNQICILIDPLLEQPPRSLKDISEENAPYEIKVLPIHSNFIFKTPDEDFLHSLIRLCVNPSLCVKMIVQDFTGRDISNYYPVQLYDDSLLNNVLFDATYGDGGCFPDLSAIRILQKDGAFLHPQYMRFNELWNIFPKDICMRQFKLRRYPIFKMAMIYRILRHIEEPRDWCKEEDILTFIPQYCKIYGLPHRLGENTDLQLILRDIIVGIVHDLCIVSESYLTESEMNSIVDGSGKEFDTMWKMVEIIQNT